MMAVGVDACRAGWVAVVLDRDGPARGLVAATLAEVADAVPQAQGFGVDIPVGLPSAGRRRADVEARALIGPRRNSVFFTPVRAALLAPTHAEATRISRELTGQGVSRQAYALGPKLLECERWRTDVDVPVWEVHPEVSFTLLLGQPPRSPKKTWDGMVQRRDALAAAGIHLDRLGPAGRHAGVDDVLDAAVVAWSVRRLLAGEGRSLPDPPEVDPESQQPMAIWG
jgi:predicted RNase H-like nuclease